MKGLNKEDIDSAKEMAYLAACAVNGIIPDSGRVARLDPDKLFFMAERHKLTAITAMALESASDTADSLNNRALSFLDLGNPAEAARCWKAALSREPGNLAATYNQGLSLWRSGRIDDVELLRRCREVSDESQESMPLPHWQQEIDAERGRDETDGRQVFDRDALITGPYAVSTVSIPRFRI